MEWGSGLVGPDTDRRSRWDGPVTGAVTPRLLGRNALAGVGDGLAGVRDFDGSDVLGGEAHGDDVFVALLSGAENDGVVVLGVPEVGSEHQAVLELGGFWEGGRLDGVAVEFGEELAEFVPVCLQIAVVGVLGCRLGLEGDLAEFSVASPVEVEVAVYASDGGLGFEDAIEAGSAEEGFVDGGGQAGALLEFFFDRSPGVAEFEGVEGRALRDDFLSRSVVGFGVRLDPFPV